ncbi:phage tail protein, probable fragment [Erwinia billingiae Eb661]|uniref:Phage tail protein, probable n=1 Tax=Erwinia billingiae (strain Eb661) TaxID=634500 RepID=D8MMM7_ERWBE|nr:phage tail protein, probable fragment [Erwinia billingiae Eb661]
MWLRENQSDPLQNRETRVKLISFAVDILANDRGDISRYLKVTELLRATVDCSKASIEAVLEPDLPEEYWTVKYGRTE